MFSSPSYPSNNPTTHQGQDHGRPGFPHSQSFTVAGMSNPNVQSPSLRASTVGGGGGMNVTGSLGDSLSQSRSHYQPGYLMSASQNNATSQSPRYDDVPTVPTKTKMNVTLTGASAADFGMDSMFQSSRQRQRQTLADEDAPPMNSVNDIVNEVYETPSRRMPTSFDSSARLSLYRPTQSQAPATPKPSTPAVKPVYLIVFGYPPDKYSATVEYFRSLGDSTEPDPNLNISNCFRIGYNNPAEAMRAVRKNGEVLSGSWMIGVKWADPAQAEMLLGQSVNRSPFAAGTPPDTSTPDVTMSDSSPTHGFAPAESSLALTTNIPRSQTPTVGTPIKLAPSSSAFRRPGTNSPMPQMPRPGDAGPVPLQPGVPQQSPNKGMLGQVSDLIFGW